MSKKGNNYLLSKTQLGAVKKGFHDLPPQEHTYGKAPQKDKYGAREVIGSWESAKQSQKKQGGKDFIGMNKESLKQGCLDSKQVGEYRKKGNEIKIKVKQGQKFYGVNIPNEEFTYGIANRPSTPIKNVICNSYAQEEQRMREERELVVQMLEGKDEKGKDENRKENKEKKEKDLNRKREVEKNNFKLSKFKNVQSKVKPIMGNNQSK